MGHVRRDGLEAGVAVFVIVAVIMLLRRKR
jgi:hypothetical protein